MRPRTLREFCASRNSLLSFWGLRYARRRRLSAPFALRDPAIHFRVENAHRQRAVEQNLAMEVLDVELGAERLLRPVAHRANAQLPDFVRSRLTRPGDVAFDLRHDLRLRDRRI